MKLSLKQFEKLLQENKLVLSFVGMSNIGKTYWSEKLTELDFKHLDCDNLIKNKLVLELKTHWRAGLSDVSHWMGQPYDKRFSTNQRKYLKLEREIMKNIFSNLGNINKKNIVIGVTGSVVHLGDSICSELKKKALVVYIKEHDSMHVGMFEYYMKNPKPVVFGNIFKPKKEETREATLERCYKKLLNQRSKLYTKYADVIIPRDSIDKNMSIKKFISLIKKNL